MPPLFRSEGCSLALSRPADLRLRLFPGELRYRHHGDAMDFTLSVHLNVHYQPGFGGVPDFHTVQREMILLSSTISSPGPEVVSRRTLPRLIITAFRDFKVETSTLRLSGARLNASIPALWVRFSPSLLPDRSGLPAFITQCAKTGKTVIPVLHRHAAAAWRGEMNAARERALNDLFSVTTRTAPPASSVKRGDQSVTLTRLPVMRPG